jgi:hypothetical protein
MNPSYCRLSAVVDGIWGRAGASTSHLMTQCSVDPLMSQSHRMRAKDKGFTSSIAWQQFALTVPECHRRRNASLRATILIDCPTSRGFGAQAFLSLTLAKMPSNDHQCILSRCLVQRSGHLISQTPTDSLQPERRMEARSKSLIYIIESRLSRSPTSIIYNLAAFDLFNLHCTPILLLLPYRKTVGVDAFVSSFHP